MSYILKCISDDFNTTFGVRPFLIIQREWTDRDYSLVDCPYLDGIHNWFAVPTMDMAEDVYNENLLYNTYISAYNFKGFSVGSGCPGFVQGDLARPNWQFIDADHGRYATKMMESFLSKKPDLVFLEGFTDLAENAAWWRSSDKIYYDYPNQRINLQLPVSTCSVSIAIILSRPDRNWKLKLVTTVTKALFPAAR